MTGSENREAGHFGDTYALARNAEPPRSLLGSRESGPIGGRLAGLTWGVERSSLMFARKARSGAAPSHGIPVWVQAEEGQRTAISCMFFTGEVAEGLWDRYVDRVAMRYSRLFVREDRVRARDAA